MCSDSNRERVFHFKKFDVTHLSAAMKVGTDGVLLGAWTRVPSAGCIWDVGTGSGLIALMLAQRSDSHIVAIDIVGEAANEARRNVAQSAWSDRITVVAGDVFECADRLPRPDLIVCNPPFFNETVCAPDEQRRMARHEGSLNLCSVIELAAGALTDEGRLTMIGPTKRAGDVDLACALAGLHIRHRLEVRTTVRKAPIRTLWEISRQAGDCAREEESLRDASSGWSEWYVGLTQDYYTHLK